LKQGRIKWLDREQQYYIGVNPYIKYLTHNACLASTAAKEAFKQLKENEVPVLLMQAENESSVSELGLKEMEALLPSMQVNYIPGSAHSIHKTQIDLFINSLDSYLLGNDK
jgi:pimeloyl-ACP methyl ester carboxylesterase